VQAEVQQLESAAAAAEAEHEQLVSDLGSRMAADPVAADAARAVVATFGDTLVRTAAVVGILLVLGLAAAAYVAARGGDDVLDFWAAAHRFAEEGNHDAALRYWSRVIRLEPHHADHYLSAGAVALEAGRPELARALLEASNPHHVSQPREGYVTLWHGGLRHDAPPLSSDDTSPSGSPCWRARSILRSIFPLLV
jgi:tetratricopeptide (TPR) repeat protein